MKNLTDNIYVAGQISEDDFAAIMEAGIKTIINNRPDNEAMMQPKTAALAAKAAALGIAFHDIPVAGGQVAPGQIEAFTALLNEADKPILAFCRSGTRSSMLWAMSQVTKQPIDDILETTGAAGYDFRGMRPMLESLKGA